MPLRKGILYNFIEAANALAEMQRQEMSVDSSKIVLIQDFFHCITPDRAESDLAAPGTLGYIYEKSLDGLGYEFAASSFWRDVSEWSVDAEAVSEETRKNYMKIQEKTYPGYPVLKKYESDYVFKYLEHLKSLSPESDFLRAATLHFATRNQTQVMTDFWSRVKALPDYTLQANQKHARIPLS